MEIRVMAKFIPQEDALGYCGDLREGSYEFDVTDYVSCLTLSYLRAITDDDYDSDDLWQQNEVSTRRPHKGPFRIKVEDALNEYVQCRLDAVSSQDPVVAELLAALAPDWAGTLDDLCTTAHNLAAHPVG